MLQETGFDIAVNEAPGLSTTYSYVDRSFDVSELQVLIAEGAVSFFEKRPMPNNDDISLISETLYLLRERIDERLAEYRESEQENQ